MKRFMALLTVLALLLAIPGVALAEAPEREAFVGDTAMASWEEEGEDSFAFTDVFFQVGTLTANGESEDVAILELFRFEFLPGDRFVQLFGSVDLAPGDYELDAAGGTFSAEVDSPMVVWGRDCRIGESPFADCALIGPFDVTVQVNWDDATGRIYPSTLSRSSHLPGDFLVGVERGLARATTANGVVDGGLSLLLNETDQATISRSVDATWVRFTAV